ncbi:hypothetical protein MUN74_17015 [Agromyces endophyticus]|uniref:hypothetical protein n=1 Tax=Agromyces sp. H17E-10 TaxID=2932244 RepID=UPI001FD1EB9B|nr:hypothetical protein [Agromyces sp. H17E-10]UOQ88946.1 hypothetical protein MUN74_17015 [Agromyces sp. H17E-10]
MLLMIVCGVLLVVGIVLTVLWSAERLVPPPTPAALVDDAGTPQSERPPRFDVHAAGLRVYLWWATVFTVVGTATGVLITGAGGRLVMRLLAATSPDATGGITEAQASVGDITLGGTISYLVIGALPAAFLSAALYLFVYPWLPRGRLGGPAFGAVLLVTLAPFVDPLRASNFDFRFVGPGWLSVVLFSALAVLHGAALAALAGRLSRSLPLVTRARWVGPSAPLVAAVVLVPVGVVLAFGAFVALVLPRVLPWLLAVRASRIGVITGRILLAVAVVAALPAFGAAVLSIVRD